MTHFGANPDSATSAVRHLRSRLLLVEQDLRWEQAQRARAREQALIADATLRRVCQKVLDYPEIAPELRRALEIVLAQPFVDPDGPQDALGAAE